MDCFGNYSISIADFQEVVGDEIKERCLKDLLYAKSSSLHFSTGIGESLKDFMRETDVIGLALGKISGSTSKGELERIEHLDRKMSSNCNKRGNNRAGLWGTSRLQLHRKVKGNSCINPEA